MRRSQRRNRQQRLLRNGIAVVAVVGVAAAIGNLMGGDEEPEPQPSQLPVPQVSFAGATSAEGEVAPRRANAEREAEHIRALLDTWYQQAFVDPALFGDGTFPEVAALFREDARDRFLTDLDVLTIGPALGEVSRVEPRKATADVTVYFQDGRRPRYAVAEVRFVARALPVAAAAFPLRIVQTGTYHLERVSRGWKVTFYDADQTQRSIEPKPSPTASP